MTRRDVLKSIHEPFGDAFYFGPESLSERYAEDPAAREESGSASKTYKDVLDTFSDTEVRLSTMPPEYFPLPHCF